VPFKDTPLLASYGIPRNIPLSRRRLLRLGLGAGVGSLIGAPFVARYASAGNAALPAGPGLARQNPFALGVASGAPVEDGFVIWTRLAPDPLSSDPDAPGGIAAIGRGGSDLPLHYEIASDPGMQRVVQRGTAYAEAMFAYSVHCEVNGLEPDRIYWYRFLGPGSSSPVGCARTAPAAHAPVDRLRLGIACCANYEQGYFAAYRHLADEAPDLVLLLGDYIYETSDTKNPVVRHHAEATAADSLAGYRNRYAQYRLDPDLQALHAAAPTVPIWDDHEVENDYSGAWPGQDEDEAKFRARRAAAYQAFYEHMPIRPSLARPGPDGMRIFDRYRFGDLMSLSMLDGRQYRAREACAAPGRNGGHIVTAADCPELLDPRRSMLGDAQERWLYDGLAQSQAQWNLIGQNVLMAPLRDDRPAADAHAWTDSWDGYPAGRRRLIEHLAAGGVTNPVVFSGDNHAFWNNDLKRDFTDPHAAAVATEFVCSSITSHGPPYEMFSKWLPQNPHVRYFESRKRGYMVAEVTRERMVARFQAISDAADPKATVSTLAAFVIEDGQRGAVTA
jgi:alkaline phosphatase D